MVRIARVSQIDYATGMIKGALLERDGTVTNWMGMQSFEYDMPKVNDLVAVDLDNDDYTEGICLGRYYSGENAPSPSGATIAYKKFGEDVVFKYDKAAKVLEIIADTIKITGNLEIEGNVKVTGDVTVSGTVKAATVVEGG